MGLVAGLFLQDGSPIVMHHQGTLCYLDEMVSWVDKIVDKNSNEDRAAWLMGYNSDQYELDRVGSGSTVCTILAVLSHCGLTLISFGIGSPTALNFRLRIIGINLCIIPSFDSLSIELVKTRGCIVPKRETAMFSQ
jgi:hypothetical protein